MFNSLKSKFSFGENKKYRNWIPLSQEDDNSEQLEEYSDDQIKGEDRDVMSWFSQAEKDPILPSLSKRQRIIGFFMLLSLGAFCFGMAGLILPFVLLKARKFVLLYTLGSLCSLGSFSLLWGPVNHLKHLCSFKRLPFTLAYFGTMFATLYAALALKKTSITIIFATLQIVALVWYVFSYIPGGTTGLKFFTKLCTAACSKTVSSTLPV